MVVSLPGDSALSLSLFGAWCDSISWRFSLTLSTLTVVLHRIGSDRASLSLVLILGGSFHIACCCVMFFFCIFSRSLGQCTLSAEFFMGFVLVSFLFSSLSLSLHSRMRKQHSAPSGRRGVCAMLRRSCILHSPFGTSQILWNLCIPVPPSLEISNGTPRIGARSRSGNQKECWEKFATAKICGT